MGTSSTAAIIGENTELLCNEYSLCNDVVNDAVSERKRRFQPNFYK
jgi:hypothetical protein